MNRIKELLDAIDAGIKRLVSPTAMLVAALVIKSGIEETDNRTVVMAFVWFLVVWAVGYSVAAIVEAMKRIENAGFNWYFSVILSSSFILVYLALFIIAFVLGVRKAV